MRLVPQASEPNSFAELEKLQLPASIFLRIECIRPSLAMSDAGQPRVFEPLNYTP